LTQYQKVLIQRNNLLKQSQRDPGKSAATLEIWNEQLARLGIKIMKKRQNFIDKLQIWAASIHSGITNEAENLRIAYKPSVEYEEQDEETVLFERFMLKLSQVQDQEMRRGVTLYGPHRDDLSFSINGKDVQTYGSQGQQRTAALSLKLAEIEFIREEVGEYPILLLDDVLSELDTYRQTQLLETFQTKVQTFITTTGVESLQMNRLENASIFHVRNGRLDP
jgi:DNA replication and repair protein RecF